MLSEETENTPPYWNLYFPGDVYREDKDRLHFINEFVNYFNQNKKEISITSFGETTVNLDFHHLNQFSGERQLNLLSRLHDRPLETIACMEIAAHISLCGPNIASQKINIRIFNFFNTTSIKNLKANLIDKFVSVRGTVVRVSNIRPVVTEMMFKCSRCGRRMNRYFKDGGKYVPPSRCESEGCKGRSFIPERGSAMTIDWQKIRIQEIVDEKEQHEVGRIPRTVEVELTRDLVESCVPGDQVTICGVVKKISIEQHASESGRGGGGKKGGTRSFSFVFIDGNSLSNSKKQSLEQGVDSMNFDGKEMQAILEIANDPNPFHLIVNSICPAIYGHEIVKAGLALTLFGGCQKYTSQKDKLPVRGDPHLLIVGDPGLGKSQLLTALSHIAPRGVYVCGNTTSTSGLTVTVVRDPQTGDFSLEAGALVLADQGICCIDEFDKMRREHEALLEAMEQQSISIAKAGMVCNLPARCSVVAAANPVGGHYNKGKTVSENLKISAALLSRFDLIFILLDNPDDVKDKLLSDHVMQLHASVAARAKSQGLSQKNAPTQYTQSHQPLKHRLKESAVKCFDPLLPLVFKKYVMYARKYVFPKLTPEASSVLQEFYLSLRKIHASADSTPITTRQLESLIRLAQARAKIELREEVTEQDALDVIEIMKESMYDVLTDEYGQLDFRRNTGTSKAKQTNHFIDELTRVADIRGKPLFTMQEMHTIAERASIQVSNFESFIDQLNNQGYLLQQPGKTYKLQTSSVTMRTPTRKSKRSFFDDATDE